MMYLPYGLGLKAEVLHLAGRSPEALEAIREAAAVVERRGERWWYAELHRLRGVFLAAIGADETQIEASFCAAIRTAQAAEVDFTSRSAPKQLHRKPSPKSKRVWRTWIPATSLVTARSALSLGLVVGSPALAGFARLTRKIRESAHPENKFFDFESQGTVCGCTVHRWTLINLLTQEKLIVGKSQ